MTHHTRNHRRALTTTALLAAVAIAAPAVAVAEDQREGAFAAWDVDGDRQLTREEFSRGMMEGGMFDRWDVDESATLDESEVKSGVFRYLDAKDDGEIAPDEYRTGWRDWFRAAPPELEAIDRDDDGAIDEREFERAAVDLGTYGGARDREGGPYEVTESEFYGGVYDSWDENADDRLAEDEWRRGDDPFPLGG